MAVGDCERARGVGGDAAHGLAARDCLRVLPRRHALRFARPRVESGQLGQRHRALRAVLHLDELRYLVLPRAALRLARSHRRVSTTDIGKRLAERHPDRFAAEGARHRRDRVHGESASCARLANPTRVRHRPTRFGENRQPISLDRAPDF